MADAGRNSPDTEINFRRERDVDDLGQEDQIQTDDNDTLIGNLFYKVMWDGDKKKSTIRAVESKDIEGYMSEKDYQSNLQALQDRIAKLEQGHGNRDTKRANIGKCYSCNSPDHFMRNYPHKNNQDRARGNFQGNKRHNTSFNNNQGNDRTLVQKADGILGQDFLLKEVSKVNYHRMVLHTIHNQEIQCWTGGKANMIYRAEIKDNMTIPPMTSTMLYCRNTEIEIPVLACLLPNLPFILDTDASDKAVGAVLSQIQDGLERVIAYMSKSMNIHVQAYCVTRKELLAVIIALKTFHHYLYGLEVLLRTDNAAVSWMKNLKKPIGQLARWLEELGTCNLTVTPRAGRKHSNADAMSRRPCKSCERQESGNQTSDDETDEIQLEETDLVNKELPENEEPTQRIEIVRVCTRSQTENQSGATPSGYCIEEWDPDSIRQCQLEDPDMSLIVTYLGEKKNKPDWDQV
ncbi:unnamed protein product [Mytilus coruscus]|uniref:Reverse transcriptase RNase H-like domain-containing protein n=1 Tax=Mytilus coruscus TaxID=42192 RepID=A0A6J8E6N7_MYTCO|nr:unnamed protein product [Mytilus coruscus]